ncbi:GNAT family N-acetyltransferase [Nonomuraea rhodomycinica]|uniref:GNAT family N-acetyltransferase n=1 Tax=Nonomuraea rhodomycinica TaxID=1712872 RepID=A0A7Y6IM93_9ACTN|nr:GNAT family N-acetyltransferase [Nonomuraea rhodomycinica]NUW40796.1 GNAT family N-acetyltransferase [Nonomuraea rhodomycinica]
MLRQVRDDDLPAMLRWRNHPRVRKASFTTHEISEEEHARWWAGVRADPSRLVLIYEHGGTACGVVTFSGLDPERPVASWGFYLDLAGLERRGEMITAWFGIERTAIRHAFDVLELTTLRGEVLAGNQAVRLLHDRFGFKETGGYRRVVDGTTVDVVTVELTRPPTWRRV